MPQVSAGVGVPLTDLRPSQCSSLSLGLQLLLTENSLSVVCGLTNHAIFTGIQLKADLAH
jgi:hypothetical protein